MLAAMVPARLHTVLRRLCAIALIVGFSGVLPYAAPALEHGIGALMAGTYQDPCAGCPDDEESPSEVPCSPACDDCVCGPGSRIAPEPALVVLTVPRVVSTTVAAPLAYSAATPSGPALDGLLRPPKA